MGELAFCLDKAQRYCLGPRPRVFRVLNIVPEVLGSGGKLASDGLKRLVLKCELWSQKVHSEVFWASWAQAQGSLCVK